MAPHTAVGATRRAFCLAPPTAARRAAHCRTLVHGCAPTQHHTHTRFCAWFGAQQEQETYIQELKSSLSDMVESNTALEAEVVSLRDGPEGTAALRGHLEEVMVLYRAATVDTEQLQQQVDDLQRANSASASASSATQ